MSDRRIFRWATTSARLLAGTLVLVAFVVGVVTAVSIPWPTVAREPVAVTATPAPAASVVVCDGGLLALGRETNDAGRLVAAAQQSVNGGVEDGREIPTEVRLSSPADDDSAASVVFVAEPQDRARTDVAAAGSATASADDLRGFAGSACRPPLMESWLVGGSAATGAADLVLLANSGTVPATVQLTVYGAGEPQIPAGGSDLVVPPGAQLAVPLAGLRLGEESPVVQVTATGAPVQAALQTSITRTLQPEGLDQVGAIALPDARQIIPGVTVTENPGTVGASDAATVLRLLSPSADTSATVSVVPVGATQPITTSTVPLTSGVPTEVELGGLPIGTYTLDVSAADPVVAAAWQTTGSGEAIDFAWYTAAPAIAPPSLFATPSGPVPVLTLVNPSDSPASVAVASVDGSFQSEVVVPAQGSTAVRLAARSVYRMDSGGADIHAGLSLAGDGALAGFPVWPSDAAAQQITVYP